MRAVFPLLTALGCSLAAPVLAQDAHEHRGFWIGFGLGAGSNVSSGFDGQSLPGGAVTFRLGGTPSQKLLVGFEVLGWLRANDTRSVSRGNGTATLLYYPSRQGLYLKGGAGIATAQEQTTSGNTTTTTSVSGFGLTLGAGLDIKVARNFYLVPAVDVLFQAFEAQTDPVMGTIPSSNTIVLFTFSALWH